MVRYITRRFLTGLVTILPLTLTVYLLYWFFVSTEKVLGSVLKFILPETLYFPGMGFTAAVLLIFCVGLMMRLYVFKLMFEQFENLLYHTPLIKSVYGAIRDFLHYFSSSDKDNDFDQVVSVDMGNGIELLGFVTLNSRECLPVAEDDLEDRVLVYLPMSYNIGGYSIMIARNRLRPVDMTMEQAMRFALTAGVACDTGAIKEPK